MSLLVPFSRLKKVETLSALKRLQELLKEGPEPFAKRIMMEISNPDIAGRGSAHDDSHASTPLLREIQEGAELIRVEVRCFLMSLKSIPFFTSLPRKKHIRTTLEKLLPSYNAQKLQSRRSYLLP